MPEGGVFSIGGVSVVGSDTSHLQSVSFGDPALRCPCGQLERTVRPADPRRYLPGPESFDDTQDDLLPVEEDNVDRESHEEHVDAVTRNEPEPFLW